MKEKTQITKSAFNALKAKKNELSQDLAKIEKKEGDIISMQRAEAGINEIEEILDSSEITTFSEKQPATVILGSRIELENLKTNDKREYTIMTRSTANPLKGVISNESPLALKVMGLKLGNTFKFRDLSGEEENFKIKSIEL